VVTFEPKGHLFFIFIEFGNKRIREREREKKEMRREGVPYARERERVTELAAGYRESLWS
jgi:hypothetical protein